MKYEDVMIGLELAADMLRKNGYIVCDADVKIKESYIVQDQDKVEVTKSIGKGAVTISYTPNWKE